MLDDVFSGLDTRSVAAISARLLAAGGHFRQSGRTIILATHNHRILPLADQIATLENGILSRTGTYEEIAPLLPQDHRSGEEDSSDGNTKVPEKATQATDVIETNHSDESPDLRISRREGRWSVYAYYFRAAGWTIAAPLGFAIVGFGFADKFSSQYRYFGIW